MIKDLVKQIRSEVRSADGYVRYARECDEYSGLKNMYIDLAMDELSHAEKICEHARIWLHEVTRDNDDTEKYSFLWECESEMIDDEIENIMSTLNEINFA